MKTYSVRRSKFWNHFLVVVSKAMAEEICHSYREKLPIVIIRPSLVWFSVDEPVNGFVESMHSGIAILCGVMTGFIRSMYVANESTANITPVDFVINATISSAWKRTTIPRGEILMYNCADTDEHQLEWEDIFVIGKKYLHEYVPYEKLFWYPNISFTSKYFWHILSLYLFQLLPAIFFDTVRLISGGKTM